MSNKKKRILWLTGIIIPQASELINGPKIPFGGWVSQMIDKLSKSEELTIGIAMKSPTNELMIKEKDGVTFYFVPQNKRNKFDVNNDDCLKVFEHFKPDLVHAEGCELKYTNTFLKKWNGENVVSMQGILNGYEPYEYGGLNIYNYLFSLNLKNSFFAALTIINKKFVFNKRLIVERDTLQKAKNILGRTTWDKANSYFYNSEAPYYHCARILRPSFYNIKQKDAEVIKHSVFIGNSAQARKGAHFVLESIALLKKEFPDIKLYITGHKYEKNRKDWKSFFGYRSLFQKMIMQLDLENNIVFLGVLQEKEMALKMAKMHVYVMSSIIENSPNTLGEAMIMGVPSITSFNGGVADMATDGIEALHYRDNDPRMLAFQIKRIFDSKELAEKLSKNAMKKANTTHDPERNLNDLVNCYKSILSKNISI